MAWELRRGKRYYYQSVYVDGRAVKKYVGRGDRAEELAGDVEIRAAQRKECDDEAMAYREATKEAERQTADVCSMAMSLLEARLLADGYYQASYTWRRRKR
ncbi:hypothetical protein N9L06_05270 [Mariniblastus sp.]|nr:hypothetical protein [Mariniblastus sp.]